MGKVTALMLITLGTQVSGQDNVADRLGERASQSGYDEPLVLDVVTLAKPEKKVVNPPPPKIIPIAGQVKTVKGRDGGRADGKTGKVFGGTNTLLSGNNMAAQADGPALPSYWGGKASDKGTGYGWSLGLKKNQDIAKQTVQSRKTNNARQTVAKSQQKLKRADGRAGRVFGGTNKLLAGAGMPAQAKGPATPSYWGGKKEDKGIGYGWSLGLGGKKKGANTRAEPEMTPYRTPLVPNLPRLAPVRPMVAGARPFLAADPLEATVLSSLSDVAFFALAMGLVSLTVFLFLRRGNSVCDQEISGLYVNLEA